MKTTLYQVDAFADRVFAGNPADPVTGAALYLEGTIHV